MVGLVVTALPDFALPTGDRPVPGNMPRWRDHLAMYAATEQARNMLKVANLFWVSAPMVQLASHAARSMPPTDEQVVWESRPSDYGLMWLDDGVLHGGHVAGTYHEEMVAAAPGLGASWPEPDLWALAWRPHPEGGFEVWAYASAERIAYGKAWVDAADWDAGLDAPEPVPDPKAAAFYAAQVIAKTKGGGPWASGPSGERLRFTTDRDDENWRPYGNLLACAWMLMGQEVLVSADAADIHPAVAKKYAKQGRPEPSVTIIELRRGRAADAGDPERESPDWRHRWIVSGHWRQQPYGPRHSLRRPVWISPFVKGPEGAPLLVTEKVRVWRR